MPTGKKEPPAAPPPPTTVAARACILLQRPGRRAVPTGPRTLTVTCEMPTDVLFAQRAILYVAQILRCAVLIEPFPEQPLVLQVILQ